MGTFCSKLDSKLSSMSPATDNQTRSANKPIPHPVVKLLIRKKIVKRRPIISPPKPVNPIFLQGRKWKNVIVTIPDIDEPPVRPARKKRKVCEPTHRGHRQDPPDSSPDRKSAVARSAKYLKTFDVINSSQLLRYLRIAKTGFFLGTANWRDSRRMRRSDLYISFSRVNESANIKTSSSPPPPPRLGRSRHRSLTNEPADSFLRDANAGGFKNFPLLTAKRDLDKLKLWKMCRPVLPPRWRPRLEHGASPARVLVVAENANEVAAAGGDRARRGKHAATAKTNPSRDGARTRGGNIEKVWRTMKKNGRKFATRGRRRGETRAAVDGEPESGQLAGSDFRVGPFPRDHEPVAFGWVRVVDEGELKIVCSKLAANRIVEDGDAASDCSLSESLNDFSCTL